jgi:hypothetical protein
MYPCPVCNAMFLTKRGQQEHYLNFHVGFSRPNLTKYFNEALTKYIENPNVPIENPNVPMPKL